MDWVNVIQDGVRFVDCCCLGKEQVVLIKDGKFLATQMNVSFSATNLLLEVTARIYYLSPCIL